LHINSKKAEKYLEVGMLAGAVLSFRNKATAATAPAGAAAAAKPGARGRRGKKPGLRGENDTAENPEKEWLLL
jgi:ribosomal protein L12E/L44/L45/RPP1/RPP2